jgi:glycine reductase complex component B subunit gamma
MLRANRIVQGTGITHPLGDPQLPAPEEKATRRKILNEALDMLTKDVQDERQGEDCHD